MKRIILFVAILMTSAIFADTEYQNRADSHAPVSIMGDHSHKKNEWMFSYRYMTMDMKDARLGSNDLSTAEILNDYEMAPRKMTMSMHMLGAMFGVSDTLSLMAMLPYSYKSMTDTHVHMMVEEMHTHKSDGLGDLKLSAVKELFSKNGRYMNISSGISLPVGSIDEKRNTGSRLPYMMQFGSGTFDIHLGSTYTKLFDRWSYGTQLSGIIRLGENQHDYRLGNAYEAHAWVAKTLKPSISVSARTSYSSRDNINGADTSLDAMMATSDTKQGGSQLDLGLGINYKHKKQRIGFEIATPVMQHFNSIQLKTSTVATLGYQYSL